MTNRLQDDFKPPMYFLEYQSHDDIPHILDYLKKRTGRYAVYFNGVTVSFQNDEDRHAFVNGLECIYNIMSEV